MQQVFFENIKSFKNSLQNTLNKTFCILFTYATRLYKELKNKPRKLQTNAIMNSENLYVAQSHSHASKQTRIHTNRIKTKEKFEK